MYVEFEITGRFIVPNGTIVEPDTRNRFRLPGGQIVSVHPVIELESGPDADDHRDINTSEGEAIGIVLDLYDRAAVLVSSDDPDLDEPA